MHAAAIANSALRGRALRVLEHPAGAHLAQWRRWKAQGKNRFNDIRRRAAEQHVDYLRQLGAPPRQSLLSQVEPKLNSRISELKQTMNGVGDAPPDPQGFQDVPEQDMLWRAEEALRPSYGGRLGQVDFAPFGSIEVQHGDIFTVQTEAVILPMLPNLMPYRGLSLEVFDRGGKDLVKDTFNNAKDAFTSGDQRPHVGDTIIVEAKGMAAKHIVFVILPWFWQGSSMDATKRLRHCVRKALDVAGGPKGFSSVALPSLGAGVHGYEPHRSSQVFLEEAVEVLLQIEKEQPSYVLKHITLIDSRRDTAEGLNHALTEVSHRWLPDRRTTTAAQYWGRATRKLILLPSRPGIFWRRHKTKFKKHHGVVRRMRHNYIANIRSRLWRAHRVAQPPALVVFEQSGEVASSDRQHRARPYYFRGVSHWLFPARRTGFQALRKGSKGQWVGLNQQYRLREDFRPRL